MTADRFCVFDPLANEWATPYPAMQPMTEDAGMAAVFNFEAQAVIYGRKLVGPARPWLVMQPVCHLCGRIA